MSRFFTILFFAVIFCKSDLSFGFIKYESLFDKKIEYEGFADSTQSMPFSEAVQRFNSGNFRNLPYSERKVYPNKAYWLRFNVKDALKDHVMACSGTHDSACLYYIDTAGKLFESCDGFRVARNRRSFFNKASFFYLPDKTIDGYFYVNVHSNSVHIGIGFHLLPFHIVLNNETANYSFYISIISIAFIFGIYSLIIFFRLSEKAYLFYSLYLFSFCVFALIDSNLILYFINFMSFQLFFLHIPFSLMTIFLMLYSIYFFKDKAFPYFRQIVFSLILLKICFSIIGISTDSYFMLSPRNDYFMLCVPFLAGVYSYFKGNKFTLYFLLAFTAVFIGYFSHTYIKQQGIIFIMGVLEIVLFSLATSEMFRSLMINNQEQSLRTIVLQNELVDQLKENEKIKDQNNEKLEILIRERTKEIEDANVKLQEQGEEIKKMNVLLQQDNKELTSEIQLLSKARVLESNVSYEDFYKMFPDELTCFSFLSELKWAKGYKCRKCSNTKSYKGNAPFSRRCSSCAYLESAVSFTVFENVRFAIDKAFYFVYIYYNNPVLNMSQLALTLDLRLATCSNFKQKIEARLSGYKSKRKKQNTDWTSFIVF